MVASGRGDMVEVNTRVTTVVDATDAKVVAHLLDRLAVVVEVVLCVVVAVFGGRNGSHGTVECI